MTISLIIAISENGIIGADGDLPWHLSGDLKRFKRLTMGHAIIMGRKTFQSIGRILPGRRSIVMTRDPNFQAEGAIVATDFATAIERAGEDDEVFVIGGAQIFHVALVDVDKVYLTVVHANVEGDTKIEGLVDQLASDAWTKISEERHAADTRNDHDYSFVTYQRTPKAT